MVRHIRSIAASVLDCVVGLFGWDVYVTVTTGRPGVGSFSLVRRAAGQPRPRRLLAGLS